MMMSLTCIFVDINAIKENIQSLDPVDLLVSTYVVCERLSVMHKQVSVHISQTVNVCPNSPESPFPEFQTTKPPPPHGKLQI